MPSTSGVSRDATLMTTPGQGARGDPWDGAYDFVAGSVVAGRFRLGPALGRGGTGQVFRADDLQLGQPVALKFLAPTRARDPFLRRCFFDEVRFARQVSHPNVCRVYDVGETAGHLFLSMELIDGEDLRTLLRERGCLPGGRAAEICTQICRGLAAIHERGLLHRDLKPANVLIDATGRARLTDFGLAAPAGSGSPGGTVAYMAPEQLAGEPATIRSDLYALGLVMYELLSGRLAAPAHWLLDLARRNRGEAMAPQLAPDLSVELETVDPAIVRVVQWCLAPDPKDRPASAEAVAAALLPRGLEPGTFLKTLVAGDLAGGEPPPRELLAEHGGREVAIGAIGDIAGDGAAGPLWLFDRPWGAVCFALAWRRVPACRSGGARLGIHLGEVSLRRSGGALAAEGPEVEQVRRLVEMARPGQTLLSPHAFALARHHGVGETTPAAALRWLSHGRYRLRGLDEAMEIFEVGVDGEAPLQAPESTEQARAVTEGFLPGWRPAPGAAVPQRPGWIIERRLGEGGFGDVWLARHRETREPRVFKFCYDVARLRALQREITIFRLLKEELGERPDITRVLGWSFEEAPYFIESEYTHGGSLPEWAQAQGGLDRVPLAVRLEIVAQVAAALAAAHSVGVLHKDVKPGNILIATGEDGEVEAQLSDFGIGVVTDRSRLAAAGITVVGLTETVAPDSSHTGGTRLYLAPELLEGKPPTLQTDIYALGLVLYQMAAGDLTRALAPGWQRDVEDELLGDDIAAAVDGSPARRLANAADLAARLRSLEARRAERAAALRAKRRAERWRRQRRLMAAALVVLAVFGAAVSGMAWRVAREAARAESEARAARQVSEFLVGLLEETDPFATAPVKPREGQVTSRDILDRGARRLEKELADQPVIRARLMNTIGRVYQRLALHEEAEEQFEKALALRRETLGPEHPDVAESLQDLGWALYLANQPARAQPLLEEALALRRKSQGEENREENPHVASLLHQLAWVAQARGDSAAAERHARAALAMQRRLGAADRDVAAGLNLLSYLLQQKGEPAAAEPLAREALAITRRLWGEHPDVAESLNNLARVLLAKGDPAGAEPLAREALAMRRRLLGDDHPLVAQSLHDVASVLVARRQYAAAEPLLLQSLALYRKALGDDSAGVAMTADSLGDLYEAWGKPEKAAGFRRKN